jgi:hypothetical protein
MLAKKITYTNFNGEEVTETFYFNLTRAEVSEMQVNHPGGYSEYLERIVESKDTKEIVDAFTTFILDSYGEKSDDGRFFDKSEEMKKRFHTSEAYSVLLMEMLEDPDKAANFITSILPESNLSEDQKKELVEKTRARIEAKQEQ